MVRQQESKSRRRYIPSEIVEEILVNLGVKSLLRFSSVSKSWNSMISDPKFINKHKKSGIRERIVIDTDLSAASTRSVISIDNAITTPLICPFWCKDSNSSGVNLLASCDDLWYVQYAGSMFLWNPSTRAYKKLPYERPFDVSEIHHYVFGLGYDSLGDDYKIVKIYKNKRSDSLRKTSEVYSLRSDSWSNVEPNPKLGNAADAGWGVAVNGALHWVTIIRQFSIISFNLSTEKYALVAMPPESPEGIIVLRGNLCLYRNSHCTMDFVLWEMQEYGVAESWTKTFVIDHFSITSSFLLLSLRPVYLYDDGRLLITEASDDDRDDRKSMFICIDEKIEPQFVCHSLCHGFGSLYSESLVSPATYCLPSST